MWLGVTDKAKEGVFLYVDGTPVQKTYWAKREPNDLRGEDCVERLTTGQWNDQSCSDQLSFLCQKPTKDGYIAGTDGNSYKFHSERLTWDAAQDVCAKECAFLAMEKSDATHSYIMQSYHKHMWLGVTDKAKEGVFLYVDGTPVQKTYWAKREPNDLRGEDCVERLTTGQWNDQSCSDRLSFLCQKPT